MLNLLNFKEFWVKSPFFKIAAQTYEAGDVLNIFLRFWGF